MLLMNHHSQLVHRCRLAHSHLESIAQNPSLRVKGTDVQDVLFHVKILLYLHLFNCYCSFLDELLLPHRLLPVYLGHPFLQPLPNPYLPGIQLYSLDFLQNLHE